MKLQKLLSCFLSVATCISMFTSLPHTVTAEAFSETVVQTVYEMDIEALKAGTVPTGITLNTSILDGTATSDSSGLISNTVTGETQFLKMNFAELASGMIGEDTGLYTIELVANLNDSDSATKNGIIMYIDGATSKFALRARESSDFCVMNANWAQPAWNATTSAEAHYTITDMNLSTGAAVAHLAQRMTSKELVNQYSSTATGEALNAANAPITGITFKVPANYRANIKSIKITRNAFIKIETYKINAVSENDTYGTVETEGITNGQALDGSEVTLTATPNDGYMFKGWYEEGEDTPVSTEKIWTFEVKESANYIAKFTHTHDIVQTVYEMDIDALKTGTVPTGITFNSSILDETATTYDALVSNVVSADTAFLTINLEEVSKSLSGEGTGFYTIEIVTNVNDSDDTTKNGTSMSLKGTADTIVFRAREISDICAMPNTWTNLYWQSNTGATATYIMESLNVTDGSATAHYLKRDTSPQYSAYADGHALEPGNATEETPINILTVKATSGRRANIKSLKITRKAMVPVEYVSVEALSENDAFGLVNDIGQTAVKYSAITLSAKAKDGYMFTGWYDGDVLVSTDDSWTFQVTENFSYTAKFRKVVDEWVEVYRMNIADILAGTTTNGVVISNLDEANSSITNALISAETDTSSDFMTITFANLPIPAVDEVAGDLLTDIYRVDMKLNLVDSDDTTKNGTLVYYNKATSANMLARVRETRDGTFYKDGLATIYGGNVGNQQMPSLDYSFKMDTETGLFNQYVKHGEGDYYLFTDTASRGNDITLTETPEKIIIRNADYNSGGVNENYRVNIKSLSVKRLVKAVDTGNAVPVFSKNRVSVVAKNGDVWDGIGSFTTDIEKIVIDLGSIVDASQITNSRVYITCDGKKIESTPIVRDATDVTLVTLTGMNFEDGKTYKIIVDGIANVRGAPLQKFDEYVQIKTKEYYERVFVKGATINGNEITGVADVTANTDITVNVEYANISSQKDVYVIYAAYKDGTTADIKTAKLENISGKGNENITIKTGDVSNVDEINIIIWQGWSTMKIFDSFGF